MACHVILIGALAQLGERLICIQEVRSSILLGSTTLPSLRSVRVLEPRILSAPIVKSIGGWLHQGGTANGKNSLSESITISPLALGSVAQVVRAHA